MRRRTLTAMLAATVVALWMPLSASAHAHFILLPNGEQQFLANGANHPAFTETTVDGQSAWQSCGLSGAAYGMETAHHGPDIGTPGAGDGCYANETRPVPGLDANPVIR